MEKKAMIDPENQALSVSRQCRLIGLTRSSFYRQTAPVISELNQSLTRSIDELYTKHPFYGSRQIRNHLRLEGHKINRKRVQRLMRLMGIQSIAPKPYTSLGNKGHKKYPYLLKNLNISSPNQVWCTDITYVPMGSNFAYLVAVMDWHSRKVLSWEISTSMDDSFCVSALERAIRLYGKPEIFNTDQGVQFTGNAFTSVLKENGIKISMDGKGRWMDNVLIERLWRTVKYEEIYIHEYADVAHLKRELKTYFHFYNNSRPHSSLNKNTPEHAYAIRDNYNGLGDENGAEISILN